jgi:hypothetical protein
LYRQYQELKRWSLHPTPIGSHTISRFLDTVHRGLLGERHRRPAHSLHYIEWALNAIDTHLRTFNQQVSASTST